MSAKKVRRQIRRLRRQRRRGMPRSAEARPTPQHGDSASTAAPTAAPRSAPTAGEPTPSASFPSASTGSEASGASRGRGARVGTALAVVAIVAVGGGSIARDVAGAAPGARPVDAALFPTAAAETPFVCPPTPGRPASLSSDGRVSYQQRDPSASSLMQGVIFAVDDAGSFPAVRSGQLSAERRVGVEMVVEPGSAPAQEASAPALAERETRVLTEEDPLRAPLLEVGPGPGDAPIAAAGLLEYAASSGPVSGLAAVRCTVPQRSQFFLGPETGSTATSVLTLANPSDREATVEVITHDGEGARGGAGTRSLVVPGQSQRTVNIAGLAAAGQVGVSVEASGAPVAAQLASSTADGSVGAGVEFLPGQTEAFGEHRMPAVPLPAEGDGGGQLWVHVPGEQEATVEVQVFGEDGLEPLDGSSVFTVDGGAVRAIDLSGVPAGSHDVVVRTSELTHAAVRTSAVPADESGGADGAATPDFAWQAGAQRLREGSGTLLPTTGEQSVHLRAGETAATATYRLMDAEGSFGEPRQIEVPAGGTAEISGEDLQRAGEGEPAAGIVFGAPEAPVVATLRSSGRDGLSLTGVEPLGDPYQAVRVRLRD